MSPSYGVECPPIVYTDLDISFCKAIDEMQVRRVAHALRIR
jgi:hypothetical protein